MKFAIKITAQADNDIRNIYEYIAYELQSPENANGGQQPVGGFSRQKQEQRPVYSWQAQDQQQQNPDWNSAPEEPVRPEKPAQSEEPAQPETDAAWNSASNLALAFLELRRMRIAEL